ncbi:MAG TPA: hypothetical protein VFJ29_04535 [Candidatus Kapabacteria bacterium]|nr:hypothetical protein [Candidatus Kapabacteria bacterium]
MKKHIFSGILLAFLCAWSTYSYATEVQRLTGVIGKNKKNEAVFIVKEGDYKGTYVIEHDIKGFSFYEGAHVVALSATIKNATIVFEKFEWEGIKDFMLASPDMLPGWEISKTAPEREIPTSMKLPSIVQPPPVPIKGIAQRLVIQSDQIIHPLQIRYFEFNSPSEAAMFAERWSAYKSVKHDTSEHFRRSYDRFAVWIVNADDERKPPEYWSARFVLESLSRKSLITQDTNVIYNQNNSDPVLYNAERDTVTVGDTVSLIGQGFSPFLNENILYIVRDTEFLRLPTLSCTSRELTTMIPWSFLDPDEAIRKVTVRVQLYNYMHSNNIDFYVKRKQ